MLQKLDFYLETVEFQTIQQNIGPVESSSNAGGWTSTIDVDDLITDLSKLKS